MAERPRSPQLARSRSEAGSATESSVAEEGASAFDRKAQYYLKRRALLYEAARLFMEGGEGKFSLTAVAQNLNITKPALYYYFKSKQEILFECYSLSFDIGERALTQANASGGTACEVLRNFLYNYALAGLTELHPTMSLREMKLEAAYSKRILERRDSLHQRMRELVTRGFKDGSITRCNPKFAVLLIIGAVGELFKIYDPQGELSAADIAEQSATLLTAGLATRAVAPLKSSR